MAKQTLLAVSATSKAVKSIGRDVQATQGAGNKVLAPKAVKQVQHAAKDFEPIIVSAAGIAVRADMSGVALQAEAQKLRAKKVIIGTRQETKSKPACAIATRFHASYVSQATEQGMKGNAASIAKNADKWLTAFRRMVNDGAKFDLNPSQTKAREAAKAKAKAAPVALTATPASDTPSAVPASVKTVDGKTVITERVKFTEATALHALAQLACQIESDLGNNSKAWENLCTLYPSLRKLVKA